MLPSDVITVGDVMYLHASAHFPFGNVGFTEIWKSIDDGHSWFRVGPRWDAHLHNGLAQLWTWDLGDDGWVYVMSTGFRLQRDRPLILRRVRPERIADPSAYEGWGFRAGEWAWRNEPTPVLEGDSASSVCAGSRTSGCSWCSTTSATTSMCGSSPT